METSGSVGCLPESEKYLLFSDNATKDRAAFHAARARGKRSGGGSAIPKLEPSGFAPTGWDKYFFYSVAQTDTTGGIHATARRGRARPAMQGPQSFQVQAFSPEEFARARGQSNTGTRTSYSEFFTQFERSTTHLHGPIDERNGAPHTYSFNAGPGDTMQRTASEPSVLRQSASQALAGAGTVARKGPHWPLAPGEERPDPMKTRDQLFQGSHRTFVDHHARDRQGPRAWQYTITNF